MTDSKTPKIGFIGLGKMGTPMCRRLKAADHEVTAFVRSDAGRAKAAELGLKAVDSIAAAAKGHGIVISAISDDKALADIVSGPGGLARSMDKGAIFVETSTVSPGASAEAATLLAETGIAYLRSPVSGSTVTAEAGQLTIVASGPRAGFDAAVPVLAAFSKKQYHVGEAEEARVMKLVLNQMVGAMSGLVGEALSLGRKGGLDTAQMLDIINNSAVASPLIGYKTKMLAGGDYTPAFDVTQMMKDFDLVLGLGRGLHCPLPLTSLIRQMYETAYAAGRGGDDFFVLASEAARRAGLE
jgi:3-hydroxyisobutyrate dehydrogenase-like beta-hydroxyacid dehydrogenase